MFDGVHARGLARGRTYAHAGRVHDLEIVAGTVSARVIDSRPTCVVSALTASSGKTVRANLSAFDVIDPRADFRYSITVQTRSVTVMSVEISYTHARARFADLLDRAVENRETLIITRHGAPSAALISAAELKSLEETAHLLRSPANARRLLRALQRALRARPRPQSVASLRREVRVGRRG